MTPEQELRALRVQVAALQEALANVVRGCRLNCTRELNCGICARALRALPEDYEL